MARAGNRSLGTLAALTLLTLGSGVALWRAVNWDPIGSNVKTKPLRAFAPADPTPDARPRHQLPTRPDVANLTATTTQPLFSPDRKPFEPRRAEPPPPPPVAERVPPVQPRAPEKTQPPAQAVPPPPPPPPADFKLVGIFGASATDRRAVFRLSATTSSSTVAVGEKVAAWRVVDISRDAVTLEAARERRVFKLFGPSAPRETR
ncbi:MAG: hypothetical protein RL291_203 [Pseudomonadota bacterium]